MLLKMKFISFLIAKLYATLRMRMKTFHPSYARHDITEILLKVALNTINPTPYEKIKKPA